MRIEQHLRTAVKRLLDALRSVFVVGDTEVEIIAAVMKRKEYARESGVITSAFALYERNLRYYEVWAKNRPRLLHPAIKLINKTEIHGRDEETERIDALIRGHRYVFTFRQETTVMPDRDKSTRGYLDLDFQGRRVMTIVCDCRDHKYAGRIWSAGDVSAFIKGPWIAELNEVFDEITILDKLARERPRKAGLEELKKKFGL